MITTEKEWLESRDPRQLLGSLQMGNEQIVKGPTVAFVDLRKVRLWLAALYRLQATQGEKVHDEWRRVVESAEAVADGEDIARELSKLTDLAYVDWYRCLYDDPVLAVHQIEGTPPPVQQCHLLRDMIGNPFKPWLPFSPGDTVAPKPCSGSGLYSSAGWYMYAVVVSSDPFGLVSEGGDMRWTATVKMEDFRLVHDGVDPAKAFERWNKDRGGYMKTKSGSWQQFKKEWRTPTVMSCATRMYTERDFSQAAFHVLADALEDAGCSSDDILQYCHGWRLRVSGGGVCWRKPDEPVPCSRGNWAVDLILGQ